MVKGLYLFCELSEELQEKALYSFMKYMGCSGYNMGVYNFLMQDNDEDDGTLFNDDGELVM